MSPDKARKIGNDLACLAASIAEIAEEIKAMFDFDQHDETESPPSAAEVRTVIGDKEKQPTLEQVRAVLAEKSRNGYTAKVRALLEKHGAAKLSEIDPAEYAALLAEAEVLGDG